MSLDTASLSIAGRSNVADVLEALTAISVDTSAGEVPQLTLTISDDAGTLLRRPGILTTGAAVQWRGRDWQVASIATRAGDDNTIQHEFAARAPLARALRNKVDPSIRHGLSPSQWVTATVKATKGIAVCQPSNPRQVIGQRGGKRAQRTLDVIADLASDLDWSWCVRDGLLLFASRKWVLDTGPAPTKLWDLRFDAEGLLDLDLAIDEDDDANRASGSVRLAYDAGIDIQPWDRIRLTGAGRYDGPWLVEAVKASGDTTEPVELDLAWPRKPSPQKARTT